MSTTARVPKAALTGFQGRLLKAVVRRKVGRVPESLEVMWNHPAVLKDMAKLGRRTEKWGRLDETPGTYGLHLVGATRHGVRRGSERDPSGSDR